jgi:ABC-type transport system involved in Fe-S cluster assembly fused permease/ATPase subunit
MIMRNNFLIILILVNLLLTQIKSKIKNDTTKFEKIFEKSVIENFETDTILITKELKIIYDGKKCIVKCIEYGSEKWNKDLNRINCNLICFQLFYPKYGKKIKNCDIVLQFKDNSIYGLNSNSGKIKHITFQNITRCRKKIKQPLYPPNF